LENLDEKQLEEMLFVVVDLMNASGEPSPQSTELNLRAARKAQTLSAFSSASSYVDYGIQSTMASRRSRNIPTGVLTTAFQSKSTQSAQKSN